MIVKQFAVLPVIPQCHFVGALFFNGGAKGLEFRLKAIDILQKPAIATDDLLLLIIAYVFENPVGVNDRKVRKTGIAQDHAIHASI